MFRPAETCRTLSSKQQHLGCAPSREFDSHFEMAEVTVAADGSFSQELKQKSVIETAYKELNEAHFTYTLSGNVNEGSAAGVYREEITDAKRHE